MSNNPRNYQLVIGVALSSIMGTMATLPGSYFWWAAAFEFAPKESHYVILIQWLFIPIGGACIAAFAAFYGGRIGLEKLKIRQTLLNNVVNSEYGYNSNSFVTILWNELDKKFPS